MSPPLTTAPAFKLSASASYRLPRLRRSLPCDPSRSLLHKNAPLLRNYSHRPYRGYAARAVNMEVELTAPNGTRWSQPVGLFTNNEFVQSSNGQRLTTIDPLYARTRT